MRENTILLEIKKISMTKDIISQLKKMGYKNVWFNFNTNIKQEEYLNQFFKNIF